MGSDRTFPSDVRAEYVECMRRGTFGLARVGVPAALQQAAAADAVVEPPTAAPAAHHDGVWWFYGVCGQDITQLEILNGLSVLSIASAVMLLKERSSLPLPRCGSKFRRRKDVIN